MTDPLYELEPREMDGSRGFVVRRIMDGQRLRWQTLPKRDGLESFNVAGTSHQSEALQDPSFAAGNPLSLIPEPLNPHDPNAIGVWNSQGTLQVGYLPRDYAAKLASGLGTGPKLAAMAIWETFADSRRVGLRVLIVHEGALVRG